MLNDHRVLQKPNPDLQEPINARPKLRISKTRKLALSISDRKQTSFVSDGLGLYFMITRIDVLGDVK